MPRYSLFQNDNWSYCVLFNRAAIHFIWFSLAFNGIVLFYLNAKFSSQFLWITFEMWKIYFSFFSPFTVLGHFFVWIFSRKKHKICIIYLWARINDIITIVTIIIHSISQQTAKSQTECIRCTFISVFVVGAASDMQLPINYHNGKIFGVPNKCQDFFVLMTYCINIF